MRDRHGILCDNKNRGCGNQLNLSLAPKNITVSYRGLELEHMLRSFNMVHFLFPPKLKGPTFYETIFVFPMVRLEAFGYFFMGF